MADRGSAPRRHCIPPQRQNQRALIRGCLWWCEIWHGNREVNCKWRSVLNKPNRDPPPLGYAQKDHLNQLDLMKSTFSTLLRGTRLHNSQCRKYKTTCIITNYIFCVHVYLKVLNKKCILGMRGQRWSVPSQPYSYRRHSALCSFQDFKVHICQR